MCTMPFSSAFLLTITETGETFNQIVTILRAHNRDLHVKLHSPYKNSLERDVSIVYTVDWEGCASVCKHADRGGR